MKKRIIIADDDAMLRIAFKSLLCWQQYGYEIIGEAENGKQALTLCRQLHPDILFTDMKMPVMDGVGLPLLGIVPEDPQVLLCANQGRPLILQASRGAATAYLNIARRLLGQRVPLMKLH